jgi:hypothetical protein
LQPDKKIFNFGIISPTYMKKLSYLIIIMTFLSCNSFSQQIFRLYEGKAPGSEGWNYKEKEWTTPMMTGRMIRNVVDPTLEVYIPDKPVANGTAIIVCPGGGNIWLSYSSEGTDVAKWLAGKGLTAFVLKYRLNKTPEDPKEFAVFTQNYFKKILAPPEEGESSKAPVPVPSEKYLGEDDGIRAVEYVREHSLLCELVICH